VKNRTIRAIALTGGMLALQMGAYLLAVREILSSVGAEAFGTFQLMRQIASVAAPVLLLGVNAALVYRLAHGEGDARRQSVSTAAGALVLILSGAVLLALILARPAWPAALLLSQRHAAASASLLGIVGAVMLYTYTYAVYLGRQRFALASALQALCFGVVPLVCVALFLDGGIYALTNAISASIVVITALLLVPLLLSTVRQSSHDWVALGSELSFLSRYGRNRMFIPLLLGIMVAAGPIALSHLGYGADAGTYLVALAMFRAIDPALTAVAVVMLPTLSVNDHHTPERIAEYARLLMHFTLGVGVFLAMLGSLLAAWASEVLFGIHHHDIAAPFRLLLFGLPFSMFFLLAQPLVDATTSRGVTVKALLAGFLVNCVGVAAALVWAPHSSVIAGVLAVAYVVSALWIGRYVVRRTGIGYPFSELVKVVSACAAVGLVCQLALQSESRWVGAAVLVCAPLVYWLLSHICRAQWCLKLETVLFAARQPQGDGRAAAG